MTRLTEEQRRDRHVTGGDLQGLITDVAALYGWSWMHIRPARTVAGWRTPIQGPLGEGWPDLFMVRERDGRRVAIELKRELGDDLTAEQFWVLEMLAAAGIETYVWRPSDLTEGRVQDALR